MFQNVGLTQVAQDSAYWLLWTRQGLTEFRKK
jgi:hypothetical protein